MASNGAEPIGSLGYDGPLAALSPERQNLADYFKETVAVVTNPAIDREREMEHFSTRAVFGRRPSLHDPAVDTRTVETSFPVLLGGHHDLAPLGDATYRRIARDHQTWLLEDLWEEFRDRAAAIDTALLESESTAGAIERLKQEAVQRALDGAELIVLTDRTVYDGERRYLDPHLATSAIDQALKQYRVESGAQNLRRRCSIVLRSAAIRNVHDVVLALGLGANGVNPYVMLEVVCVDDYAQDVSNVCAALSKGIEKVISTIGIHEVRGYARQFSSIGIRPELAEIFQTEAFAASASGGVGFARSTPTRTSGSRSCARRARRERPAKTFRFYPKVYKAAVAAANGSAGYEDYSAKVRELEAESPISMRHIMGLRPDREPIDPSAVDAAVGHHDYPIVISSMSFGSQSEPAFRSYAEAAKQINVLCVNGEGGEIRDMYGRYRKWRGQQVASGRFGVSAEMLNASYVAEIKIGQGAKPGEGGHLPGKKVSEKVAAARNASPGTDLISPSNNHDLYSIEDLAELIDELKTVNPDLRVSVKVPVVPNIGTIGLGIAKAGADIITLSGFEGGTGRGAPARAAPRRPALGHRHPARPPGADGGRDPQPGRDLGRRRLPPRPRHPEADLHGGEPDRLRHPGDGLARLHDLPRLPARHLPRRDRDPDRDPRGGDPARAEEVHAAGGRDGGRQLRPLLRRHGRGGPRAHRRARLRAHPGPRRPLRPARAGRARRRDRSRRAAGAARAVPGAGPGRPPRGREAEPAEARAEAGLVRARPIRMEPKAASAEIARLAPRLATAPGAPARVPAGHRRQRPRPRDRARRGDRAVAPVRRSARGLARRARGARLQRRLGRRPGVRCLQRLRAGRPGRGRRAGRGRQDDAGRHRLDPQGPNRTGKRVNGSVGKSFAYGAQRGRLFVQGSADSRFCIRLSGADVVLGGEPAEPLDDARGCVSDRANAKGFAFEYMTSGRAVVLGDIGPWACAGMTGGRVYVRQNPEWNLDREAIMRRLGEGAKVSLVDLDAEGMLDIEDLLGHYAGELRATDQEEEAERMLGLAAQAAESFLMIIPEKVQADPNISTEEPTPVSEVQSTGLRWLRHSGSSESSSSKTTVWSSSSVTPSASNVKLSNSGSKPTAIPRFSTGGHSQGLRAGPGRLEDQDR